MRKIANCETLLSELRESHLFHRSKLTSNPWGKREALQTPQNVAVEDLVPLLHEQFVTLAHHRRNRETLASIDAALERMDRDEFGICEGCGRAIPPVRLRAVPWTSLCVACQEQMENANTATPVEEPLNTYS